MSYRLKAVTFAKGVIPIVMQNENGPCPLLAICNLLLLQGKIKIHPDYSCISFDDLITLVRDFLSRNTPSKFANEEAKASWEFNLKDALSTLPKLGVGLDVNVKFSNITGFEYTPDMLIFDLLSITLVHGWLPDPHDKETHTTIAPLSYNQLVEKMVEHQAILSSSAAPPPSSAPATTAAPQHDTRKGEIIEKFMHETASQLTYHGLVELHQKLKDEEFYVFFRNNHFSTLYKRKGELFLLVTDQGYLYEPNVVWEKLGQVDGDTVFATAMFEPFNHSLHLSKTAPEKAVIDPLQVREYERQQQTKSDFELAKQLQEKEKQEAKLRSRSRSHSTERMDADPCILS